MQDNPRHDPPPDQPPPLFARFPPGTSAKEVEIDRRGAPLHDAGEGVA